MIYLPGWWGVFFSKSQRFGGLKPTSERFGFLGGWMGGMRCMAYLLVHLYSQRLTSPQSAPRLVIGSFKFHHVWLVSEGLQTFWKASKWQKKEWMSELQLGDLNYETRTSQEKGTKRWHRRIMILCQNTAPVRALGQWWWKTWQEHCPHCNKTNPSIALLGGGVFFFLFSRLFGEDSYFDIFVKGVETTN